jgi:hypothetical protein
VRGALWRSACGWRGPRRTNIFGPN